LTTDVVIEVFFSTWI